MRCSIAGCSHPFSRFKGVFTSKMGAHLKTVRMEIYLKFGNDNCSEESIRFSERSDHFKQSSIDGFVRYGALYNVSEPLL